MTGWDGFAKYVGVQGVLALMMGGAIVYLMVTGRPIGQEVTGIFGIIVGFYFGKNGRMIVQDIQDKVAAAGGG
jgi:hypothetical protein